MHPKLTIQNRQAKKSHAFTLSEVIIASTLLIVAMIPILQALTTSYLGSIMVEHRTHSLALAQGKLDEIKAKSIYNYADSFTENDSSLDGTYLGNVTDSGSGSDLRTITVAVGFDLDSDSTLDGDEINISLTTLVAKRW